MNKAVNIRHPSGKSRANLWKVRDAKERGDAYCGGARERQIVNRDAVRQVLAESNTGF